MLTRIQIQRLQSEVTHIAKRREQLVIALSKFDHEDQRASIKSTFKFFEQLQREHNQVL